MKKADKDLIKGVHKTAGRAILPPNRVFKDKKKYNRKQKHKGKPYNEAYPFFMKITLSGFSLKPC